MGQSPREGDEIVKVLVVGLDAACYPVLEPLFERGVCPTLEELFESGTAAPLESQVPPWTPSAWPSIFTGTNPGKHGTYCFVSFDGYDWDVVTGDGIEEPAIWELLDRQGYGSVVVNVPVTHPPTPIDGAVLPGFLGPEEPACHPEGLLEDVREACGGYRVYPEADRTTDAPDEEVFENWLEVTRMRGAATRYLADGFDPDFGFVQFQRTDTIFHEFPRDTGRVEELFRTVDEEIEATLEATDPDAVFVVSDHGIGPYDGYEFRVNEYLEAGGYVEPTRDPRGMPSWNPTRSRLRAGGDGDADDDPGVLARAAAAPSTAISTPRISSTSHRRCWPPSTSRPATGWTARSSPSSTRSASEPTSGGQRPSRPTTGPTRAGSRTSATSSSRRTATDFLAYRASPALPPPGTASDGRGAPVRRRSPPPVAG